MEYNRSNGLHSINVMDNTVGLKREAAMVTDTLMAFELTGLVRVTL